MCCPRHQGFSGSRRILYLLKAPVTQQSGCYVGFLGQVITGACIWWHICGYGISTFHTEETSSKLFPSRRQKLYDNFYFFPCQRAR